jgi:3-hydroxybutyryl-CoA dehydrogenase
MPAARDPAQAGEQETTPRFISVVGAGQMGSGIAQVAAMSGYPVLMHDLDPGQLDRGRTRIRASLDRFIKSGRMDQAAAQAALDRIQTTTRLDEAADHADFIFENVPEILELKQEVFTQLDRIAPPHAVLATNTSQLSPTAIGRDVGRRDRVLAMHWFNPPPIMKLIEVIRALETSDDTVGRSVRLASSMGKDVVICQKDSPGFIVTRLLLAQRAEALRLLDEGIASVADIDRAIELALNHPMGPFKLADQTGLDTALRNMEYLAAEYGGRFRPTATLRNMVQVGRLGRKSGRGFYGYQP